jgi:pimeloyl-ACP methyl ester carboxylesterase
MKRSPAGLLSLLSLVSVHAAAADAPGEQFARVGANQLAWECRGEGGKTVVLIAGMGLDAHATYKNTFRHFALPGYQVCLYDRAGVGKSTPQSAARPLRALADELDGLIRQRGWRDVVLVSHSFGGLIARAYAQAHPDVVKGIVFVDSVHESWYAAMQRTMSPEGWRTMDMVITWERDKNSHEDFVEAIQALGKPAKRLDLPVTVLSRGLPYTNIRQAKMSYDDVDAFNTTWDAAQFELTKVSDDMRHVRMRYAAHLFDEQDPWLVLDEIGLLARRVEARGARQQSARQQ